MVLERFQAAGIYLQEVQPQPSGESRCETHRQGRATRAFESVMWMGVAAYCRASRRGCLNIASSTTEEQEPKPTLDRISALSRA